jgi:amino acid permease
MNHIKNILIIILFYFIYYLINKKKNNKENLDVLYDNKFDTKNIEEECVRRELMDSDFLKKIYSIDDNEIIFF